MKNETDRDLKKYSSAANKTSTYDFPFSTSQGLPLCYRRPQARFNLWPVNYVQGDKLIAFCKDRNVNMLYLWVVMI